MLSKGNMISFTFLHLNIHLKLPNFKISNFFFSIFDSHLVQRITSSQRFHALSEGKALRGRSPETFRYAKMSREALQREYFRLIRSITVTFSSKMIRADATNGRREKEEDRFAFLRLGISDGQGRRFILSPWRFMQICTALTAATVILFFAHKSNTGHAAGIRGTYSNGDSKHVVLTAAG